MINKLFIRVIYLKNGEELMEIDTVALIIYLGGTFLFGVTVGEFIERYNNKESLKDVVKPIINKYLKQKDKMFDKVMEDLK